MQIKRLGQVNIDKPYTYVFSCMSTKCTLQIYASTKRDLESICKKVEKNTKELEKKYNFYDANSYLSSFINNRHKQKIKVDKQTSHVLKIVRELSEKVNYLFDITVGTYKHCYNLKTLDEFKKCVEPLKKISGFDAWDINGKYLEFSHKDIKLDLGGVIKEFAVDEGARILSENGVISAIVNFGGDIFALGQKPNAEPFTIGVKNPKDKEETLLRVQIADQALTTSANYERSYDIEDKNFSHILSKKQNTKDILSSTIICESALKSGIYSTAFMIDVNIDIPNELKVVLIDKELNLHQNIR